MNNADIDPYRDMPIPAQQPLDLPRPDDEYQWEHLDGQTYEPSPCIIPDTQVGFDMSGSYHAIEHFTAEALNNAITPHRWANYLNDAMLSYISTFDYTVGASERDDIIQDIVSERMEQLDTTLEALQLEKALELWRQKYHYGIRK